MTTHMCVYIYECVCVCVCVCEREYYCIYNDKFECMRSQNTALTVTVLEQAQAVDSTPNARKAVYE